VIFNMKKVGSYPVREGTQVDARLLTDLFEQLHFDVQHLPNYTAEVCFLQRAPSALNLKFMF